MLCVNLCYHIIYDIKKYIVMLKELNDVSLIEDYVKNGKVVYYQPNDISDDLIYTDLVLMYDNCELLYYLYSLSYCARTVNVCIVDFLLSGRFSMPVERLSIYFRLDSSDNWYSSLQISHFGLFGSLSSSGIPILVVREVTTVLRYSFDDMISNKDIYQSFDSICFYLSCCGSILSRFRDDFEHCVKLFNKSFVLTYDID